MKIPFSVAERVQWNFVIMVSVPDDFSPSDFSYAGLLPEKEACEDWQNSVDIIRCLLQSKLLLMVGADKDENFDWLYWELAKNNPFDAYEVGVWMGPLLHPSPQCKALLKKHGIDNPDVPTCTSFWEEIEILFEAAGVPWAEEPIFPIRTKWTLLQRAEGIRQAVIRRRKNRLVRIERERSAEIARKEKMELLENRIFRRLEQKMLGKRRSR